MAHWVGGPLVHEQRAHQLNGVGQRQPVRDNAHHRRQLFARKENAAQKYHGREEQGEVIGEKIIALAQRVVTKKKQGFGLPFGVWANAHPGLKALATDSLHSLARRGVVREEFVRTLISQRLPEHPGYYGEMVWILMMLEQWLAAKAPRFNIARE